MQKIIERKDMIFLADVTSKVAEIRQAVLGEEVREALASGIEVINTETVSTTAKQDAQKIVFDDLIINAGSSNAEIVAARSGEVSLPVKIEKIDSSLANMTTEKSDVTYVDSQDALKRDKSIKINAESDFDDHTKSLITGVSPITYSNIPAEKTIDVSMLSDDITGFTVDNHSIVKALLGSEGTAGRTKINEDPIKLNGKLTSVSTYQTEAGAIKIKIFSKNADGTFNLQNESQVTAIAGKNIFPLQLQVQKGWYIGIYTGVCKLHYTLQTGFTNYTFVGDAIDNNIIFLSSTTLKNSIEYFVIPIISTFSTLKDEIKTNANDIFVLQNKLLIEQLFDNPIQPKIGQMWMLGFNTTLNNAYSTFKSIGGSNPFKSSTLVTLNDITISKFGAKVCKCSDGTNFLNNVFLPLKLKVYANNGGIYGALIREEIIYIPIADDKTTTLNVAESDYVWRDATLLSPLNLVAGEYWFVLVAGTGVEKTVLYRTAIYSINGYTCKNYDVATSTWSTTDTTTANLSVAMRWI